MQLSFAEPLYLLGLLAAGLPWLAALLLRRRKGPATTAAAAATTAAARRAFRCRTALASLLLALVGLGFAGPVLGPRDDDDAWTILVLDRSASMAAATGGGASALDRARAEAFRALGALPASARVALVLTPGVPEPDGAGELLPPASLRKSDRGRNRAALERTLREIEAADEAADPAAAVALAAAMLAAERDAAPGQKPPPPRIIFLSDFQRTGWGALDLGGLPPGTRAVLLDPNGRARSAAAAAAASRDRRTPGSPRSWPFPRAPWPARSSSLACA